MAGEKNTLGRPPRLPNGAAEDTIAIVEYLTDIYKAVVLEGKFAQRLIDIEAKLAAIAQIAEPPASASGSYTQAEVTAAFAAIRSIIEKAGPP